MSNTHVRLLDIYHVFILCTSFRSTEELKRCAYLVIMCFDCLWLYSIKLIAVQQFLTHLTSNSWEGFMIFCFNEQLCIFVNVMWVNFYVKFNNKYD